MFKWQIYGNLGGDPETREVNGKTVANASVAVRNFGKDSPVSWVRVSIWGNRAEAFAKYAKKGSGIIFYGSPRHDENGNPRIWTTNDGESRASFEMTVDDWYFGGSKSSGDTPEASETQQFTGTDKKPKNAQEADDIPW